MLTAADRRPWIVTCRRGDGLRLICFPYAGGGPSLFRGWPLELSQQVEVCAVQLPGREARMKEPPIGDLRRLVAELADAIEPSLDRPIALFGHSVGGLVAFEFARELRRRYDIEPVHLFVSGCPAPQVTDDERLSELPDGEFLERMRRFNGTPSEILEHAEMMELVLPTLRADFSLRDTYRHRTESPLGCAISAFGGMADQAVGVDKLNPWSAHTTEGFQLWLFQGDHFFVRTAQAAVVEAVMLLLQPHMSPQLWCGRSVARTQSTMSGRYSMNHESGSSCGTRPGVNGIVTRNGGLMIEPLSSDGSLPLVVTPVEDRALDGYLAAARHYAEAFLPVSGGLLFRGLPIRSVADFESFIGGFTSSLVSYEFGSTPRSRVQRQVYTSTEYPPHQHIPLHNEQAYTREWPMKIWFYCGQAPEEGGYTPIADSREVYRRIPARIRERFNRKQIMYVRNYGNGLDVPWQKVFNTEDPAVVEAFCRTKGILYEWKADGELRTRQVAQAIAVHPRTGETVWFNQAHLFHVSNLEPTVREDLLAVVAEEDLPRNACYGDGSPIESDVLDEIRDVYRSVAVQFSWQEGDVMMLDNMLAAHGRTPFKGRRQILVAMAEPCSAGHSC